MFDTYAEIFEKRAADYHHAMRQSPRARDAEFLAVLDPIRDARRARLRHAVGRRVSR